MRKRIWIALLLIGTLLLGGCSLGTPDYVSYKDMAYTRPDLEVLMAARDAAICTAESESNSVETVLDAITVFYDEYDWFYTCYSLADIRYCSDLTDIYWEKEYNYCAENSARVDAALEELYYSLAQSPHREALESPDYFGPGYFDQHEGENLWDDAFTALLEQEQQLQSQYYSLYTQALDHVPGTEEYYDLFGDQLAQVLVELIGLRQQMAGYWGYEDYAAFAGDFYYGRDYAPEEMESYLGEIRTELVPLYRELDPACWDPAYDYSSEEETFRFLEGAAKNMGGTIAEAFALMRSAELYDIAYGENKYNASFETYLTSYYEPFIFLNPGLTRYDWLSFAHEFGHFCNDYACYGSYSGLEVTEVFSQGMEYLALCYGEDAGQLLKMKLADSLSVYVEQAAYASFEQQMYDLSGEELTVQALYDLYDRVAREFGLDYPGFDPREFVTINHFFTNPLYIISYVVSNDAALQVYQLELENTGRGLALLEESLYTQQYYFQDFLAETGLESPFAPGRIGKVKETFETLLG